MVAVNICRYKYRSDEVSTSKAFGDAQSSLSSEFISLESRGCGTDFVIVYTNQFNLKLAS